MVEASKRGDEHFSTMEMPASARHAGAIDIYFCEHGFARFVLSDKDGAPIAYVEIGPEGVREVASTFAAESAKAARRNGYQHGI